MSSKILKSKQKKQTSKIFEKNQSIKKSKTPNKKINKSQNKKPKTQKSKDTNFLSKKNIIPQNTSDSSFDSSDEELLVRTGDVPEEWYDSYNHIGYDINSKKVEKIKEEDEIEKFINKANDKDWWRKIYDSKNNKTLYLSDTDLELINRIRKGKFANKSIAEEEYFEENIPYQIHPLKNKKRSKKSFGLSKNERKTINRLIYLYKNGFMPLEKEKKEENKNYDIWEFENENSYLNYRPGFGFQAPKRELPETEESYNPPLNNNNEKREGILRRIPRYDKLIDEELERCCDLFLSTRIIRKKMDIKESDLLPDLPHPDQLKPFPTKETIVYKGHNSSIKAICVDSFGNILISADNGNFVHFYDVLTGKIICRIDFKEKVKKIVINDFMHLIVICTITHIYFILPKYLEKKYRSEILNIVNDKIKPLIIQKLSLNQNNEKEENEEEKNKTKNDSFIWKIPKENSKKEKNGILFYLKFTQGTVNNITFHIKGDYFSTLSKNASGKPQVYIHSISKMTHQLPISHIKGNVNAISFHPNKPYFIVATNSNLFIYNLQKQELIRKFISNLNTICKISIDKSGSDLIAGDKSGKVGYFQLELSNKPFKLMDFHNDKIKSIEFHNKLPLFLSCSRNGKILVYHSKVTEDELTDPLIVPLRELNVKNSNKTNFSCACFHPKLPWIFSGGEDGLIRMWS